MSQERPSYQSGGGGERFKRLMRVQAHLFLNVKRTCPVFLFTAIFICSSKAALPQGPPKEKRWDGKLGGGLAHSQYMCACVFTREDVLGL